MERAAKTRKGKLILDHHRAKKPSHVAEPGGKHMEALHNFPQHRGFSAQSEVIFGLNFGDSQQQSEQIQEIVVADRQEPEFVSYENQEQVFAKDAKVALADSEESVTEHVKEADTTIADRQELSQNCYLSEEKLINPQLIIIEPEKIIVSPELKAADFIEAGIS